MRFCLGLATIQNENLDGVGRTFGLGCWHIQQGIQRETLISKVAVFLPPFAFRPLDRGGGDWKRVSSIHLWQYSRIGHGSNGLSHSQRKGKPDQPRHT